MASKIFDPTCINENVNRLKAEFLERFESLVKNIKEEHFKRFRSSNDTEEVNVKIDGIKKQLTKLIVDEFTEVWEDMDVDDTLRRLEAMKQVANNEDAWRPTGKSVAEQTKFYRIQLLQGQIDYFEPKIMKQQEVLKKLIVDVETKRQCMANILKQRRFLLSQIKARKEQLAESKEKNKRLLLKLEEISDTEDTLSPTKL